jgi:hypothetical protein
MQDGVWGPKSGDRGTGAKGLKDNCVALGYAIKVAVAMNGKTAKDKCIFKHARKVKWLRC